MPTAIARPYLLTMLAILLAACASESANRVTDDTGPMRVLVLPPQAGASPAVPAAKQPAPDAKSDAPTPVAAAAPTSAATAAPTSSATAAPTPAATAAPKPAAAVAPTLAATEWPLALSYEGNTFQVSQPIVESLDNGILTARSAVTAQPSGQAQPVRGSVTMKAVAETDSAAGVASLVDLEVLGVSFPAGADLTQAWQEFLRFAVPAKIRTVPLAALEAGRTNAQTRQRATAATAVTAPRIIVSERPAVLVYIDGDPRYAPLKGTELMGVLNTRVLLLTDPAGNYYLHLYNGWVSAPSLEGPWEVALVPPDTQALEQSARDSGRVNFLPGRPDANGGSPLLSVGHLPDIVVAMQPTALIVLDGAPRYVGVAGTTLQYAANTSAHLFRDTASGDVYVRVGGFWFRAADISGSWAHVPAASLPAAFSAIPDDSPKRAVKTSIAAAQSPTGSNNLYVVAADPGPTGLSMEMNGDPVLEPIPGTGLNYVANASVPVIQLDINNWYAVQNGVWFYSIEATGPWTVTNRIPPEIYAIPPNVPIYRAIHSSVSSTSTDVTFYGYPGIDSLASQGGAIGVEEQGSDYQYTPPSGMYWGWSY